MSTQRHRWFDLFLPCAVIIALAIAANLAVLKYPSRWDLTEAAVYSIGPETRAVLEALTTPVNATFFYNIQNRSLQDAKRLLEQYAAVTPKFHLRSVDTQREPSIASRYGINFPGTTIFESAGRKLKVDGGSEVEFTNAVIRISRANLYNVCFLDGHGEGDPFSLVAQDHLEGEGVGMGKKLMIQERDGMALARASLETLGYRVSRLSLTQAGHIPRDCHVIIIAGPRYKLLAHEMATLGRWLDASGKLAVFLDKDDAGLGPLLARYGIHVTPATVLDPGSHYGTDENTPAVTQYVRHKLTRNLPLSYFPAAITLSLAQEGDSEMRYIPFLQTSDTAYISGKKHETGPLTLGVLATRQRGEDVNSSMSNSELIVIGDSDFARNAHFATLGNGALFQNVINYLTGEDNLSNLRPRNYELPKVTLTGGQMEFTFFFSAVFFPLIALIGALWAWLRRR